MLKMILVILRSIGEGVNVEKANIDDISQDKLNSLYLICVFIRIFQTLIFSQPRQLIMPRIF